MIRPELQKYVDEVINPHNPGLRFELESPEDHVVYLVIRTGDQTARVVARGRVSHQLQVLKAVNATLYLTQQVKEDR